MWAKTSAALLGGCLVSISIMLNLNFILPFAIDTRLFVGLILAFPLWIAAMIWCYGSRSGWVAWRRCGLLLLVSGSANAVWMLGAG